LAVKRWPKPRQQMILEPQPQPAGDHHALWPMRQRRSPATAPATSRVGPSPPTPDCALNARSVALRRLRLDPADLDPASVCRSRRYRGRRRRSRRERGWCGAGA
jgi:hypothetical protein